MQMLINIISFFLLIVYYRSSFDLINNFFVCLIFQEAKKIVKESFFEVAKTIEAKICRLLIDEIL